MLPIGSTWSVMGAGTAHLQMITLGIALGGNVRVGLEDVLELDKGVPVSNVDLVKKAVSIARIYGREPASPDEAREILGLPPNPGANFMETPSIVQAKNIYAGG
jgi:3-keto-5-aminohexanoate cleavage enzyme